MKQKNKLVRTHQRVFDPATDACYLAKVARQERKKENVSKKEEDTKEKGSLEKEA
jgi:hypothetical protein